jgi:hypothetical protein
MGQEEFPMQWKAAFFASFAMALAGCSFGARDVDTSPSRAIASDMAATQQSSPSAIRGQRARDEPYDATPWEIEGRH